jgi:hypothetical protein
MFIINAPIMVALFGRGTGKTYGVTATWIYNRARILTRSTGFVCSPSYSHLIDTIIPEMEQGWKSLGLTEGIHYWLYKAPPPELRIPQPYLSVDNPKYFIFWSNGSVTKLVSLDRKALVNSKSFDYGAICEGRKCKGQIVKDDLMPTLRGGRTNIIYDHRGKPVLNPATGRTMTFADKLEHHSLLIESDLPRDVQGRWILEYKKKTDYATIQDMLRVHAYKSKLNKHTQKKEIKEADDLLNEMRRGLVYVGKASTLDNIHVLGIEGLKRLRQNLGPVDWDVSVLGIEQDEIDNCFYVGLSADHGYSGFNYTAYEAAPIGTPRNWRFDMDLSYKHTLDIVMDCNARHNCIAVNQVYDKKINLVNYFYNESSPGNPKDHMSVAQDFCDYYDRYPNRNVKLIVNNTMISGEMAGQSSKRMDVQRVLAQNGFKVEYIYLGQAMWHDTLHDEWKRLFQGKSEYTFAYNINHAELWAECCKNAPVKLVDGPKGQQLKKNKSSENNPAIPPHQATHATEAEDQYLQYILNHYRGDTTGQFYGGMFS